MKLSLSKKVLGGVVAVGILTASMVAAIPVSAAASILTITAPANVANGATFNVTVAISAGVPIAGAQAKITFDNTKVTYVPASSDTIYNKLFAADGQYNLTATTANSVTIVSTTGGGPAVTPSGTWATLKFTAISSNITTAFGVDQSPLNSFLSDAGANSVVPNFVITNPTTIIGTPLTPDLTVSNVVATGTDAHYTVSFRVNNVGGADSAATTANLVVEGGTAIPFTVDALAAGAHADFTSTSLTISGQTDTFVITADPNNIVASETNETNNTASGRYDFLPPGIPTTGVSGTVTGTISFTQPNFIDFGAMTLGNNPKPGTLNVKSNAAWQVSIESDISNGKMTKWNIATGVYTASVTLHNALQISTSGGYANAQAEQPNPSNHTVTLSSTPTLLATGVTDGQVTNADGLHTDGENRDLSYDQLLVASDAALNSSSAYHIVVLFTASQVIA